MLNLPDVIAPSNRIMLAIQPSCADEGDEFGQLRVDQAVAAMLTSVTPVAGTERVDLGAAVDRILAEPVTATFDVPPSANSAVDGYAVRHADLPAPGQVAELPTQGLVLAGQMPDRPLEPGTARRIMTGALLPEGADTVLMQERVVNLTHAIRIDDRHRVGDNVRHAGEDLRAGAAMLNSGRRLTPADIGLLASQGIGEVGIRRRLHVAILSTGDELRAIGQPRDPGCIFDSNRHGLRAALHRLGCSVTDLGIVADDPAQLRAVLLEAAAQADVVVSSGGVSVGDADFVKPVLQEIGDIAFWKVAIKPGRPVAFGHIGKAVFFGLPGNPVAVLVTYYHLVRPVLERCAGVLQPSLIPSFKAVSEMSLRKRPGRTEYQRGVIFQDDDGGWRVRPAGKQGSGILSSMTAANAFILLPHDSGPVEPGDTVTVIPFAGLV